ncbi:DUF4136 domain-containing protein [Spirosoma arcticum]
MIRKPATGCDFRWPSYLSRQPFRTYLAHYYAQSHENTPAFLFVCFAAQAAKCQINVDYDHAVDFNKYRTFGFAPGKVMRKLDVKDSYSTLINNNVKEAVTQILSKKGLSSAEVKADLTITFMAGAKEKKEIENYIVSPRFGYGYCLSLTSTEKLGGV